MPNMCSIVKCWSCSSQSRSLKNSIVMRSLNSLIGDQLLQSRVHVHDLEFIPPCASYGYLPRAVQFRQSISSRRAMSALLISRLSCPRPAGTLPAAASIPGPFAATYTKRIYCKHGNCRGSCLTHLEHRHSYWLKASRTRRILICFACPSSSPRGASYAGQYLKDTQIHRSKPNGAASSPIQRPSLGQWTSSIVSDAMRSFGSTASVAPETTWWSERNPLRLKAIAGVAHGIQHPDRGPLGRKNSSGEMPRSDQNWRGWDSSCAPESRSPQSHSRKLCGACSSSSGAIAAATHPRCNSAAA